MRVSRLSLNELKAIKKMFMDNDVYVVRYNENYILSRPSNNWDLNYKLEDLKEDKIYLIDINDIEDQEDLKDYEYLKSISWKIIKGDQ